MRMSESLKIVVFVGKGDAELTAEIEQYEPRARASRLRYLANLGLQSIRQGAASPPPLPVSSPPPPLPAPAQEEAARRVKGKLRQSLAR
jgi:hypothetical protein